MWSDAALANRRDLSSTGGFVLAATNQSMLRGDLAPLSLISWRSAKLQRKARSSLAAEAQALSEADQELMYTRLQWSEFCGFPIDLKDTASSVSRIKGAVVIDAKALFDVLQKKDLNSAGGGLRDKFSFLEVLCLLESLEKHQTDVKWVHSEIQLADALTKPLPHGVLQKVLIEGKWRLTFDPNFVSSKRLRKQRNCTEGNMVISGTFLGRVSLSSSQPQAHHDYGSSDLPLEVFRGSCQVFELCMCTLNSFCRPFTMFAQIPNFKGTLLPDRPFSMVDRATW